MNRKRFHLLLFFMIALLISACNSHTERPSNPQQLIQNGQSVYAENCASCHGTDGTGQQGKFPRLAGNPMVTLEDPIPIIQIVVYGKRGMPSFGQKLRPDQAAEVLSYIRNTWGNQAVAVSSRQIP